jgi:hypothetical protein
VIGTSMFIGEWILGSIGWGVLHGVLLFVAIAVACSLAAVGVSGAGSGAHSWWRCCSAFSSGS